MFKKCIITRGGQDTISWTANFFISRAAASQRTLGTCTQKILIIDNSYPIDTITDEITEIVMHIKSMNMASRGVTTENTALISLNSTDGIALKIVPDKVEAFPVTSIILIEPDISPKGYEDLYAILFSLIPVSELAAFYIVGCRRKEHSVFDSPFLKKFDREEID